MERDLHVEKYKMYTQVIVVALVVMVKVKGKERHKQQEIFPQEVFY